MEIQCLANVIEEDFSLVMKVWTLQQKMVDRFGHAAAPVAAGIVAESVASEEFSDTAVPQSQASHLAD